MGETNPAPDKNKVCGIHAYSLAPKGLTTWVCFSVLPTGKAIAFTKGIKYLLSNYMSMSDLKKYLLVYHWHGRMESFILHASDLKNCKKKMKALHNMRFKIRGEVKSEIPENYSPADFVWLGMKIEQMQRMLHLRSMDNEKVTHFIMSKDLSDRLFALVKEFPHLMPDNLKAITVRISNLIEDDAIGTMVVKD